MVMELLNNSGLYLGKRYEASDSQKGVKIPNFENIKSIWI